MQDKTEPETYDTSLDEVIQSVKMAESKLNAQIAIDKGLRDIFLSIQAYKPAPSNNVMAREVKPVISSTIKKPKI